MGYNIEYLHITARLSNHNSEQDEKDQAQWDKFIREVKALAAEYDIVKDVMG